MIPLSTSYLTLSQVGQKLPAYISYGVWCKFTEIILHMIWKYYGYFFLTLENIWCDPVDIQYLNNMLVHSGIN